MEELWHGRIGASHGLRRDSSDLDFSVPVDSIRDKFCCFRGELRLLISVAQALQS